jgi:hypothetical protein
MGKRGSIEGCSKAGRDITRLGATWATVLDTGYTLACPTCGERGNENSDLIGKPRSVEIEDCDKCKSAPKYKSRFQRFYGTGGLGRGY